MARHPQGAHSSLALRGRVALLRDGWPLSRLEDTSRAPGPPRLSASQRQGRKPVSSAQSPPPRGWSSFHIVAQTMEVPS